MTRIVRLAAAAAAGLLTLTGCGFKGAYSLPLPGGSGTGPVYHVTAYFTDVQDLVPMSAVRVNDVAVGDVTSISYDPRRHEAVVKMRIKKSVHLPANATATLEQTTLLGEKYVALEPPTDESPSSAPLGEGAVIADHATSNLPDVEEVFGLLSAVLNGGDIQDLQTINLEISKALGGREQQVRSALHQVDVFVSDLDNQRQQIVRALDALNRFSAALAKQNGTLADALDRLGPGLKVLADETPQFTKLLTDLSRFGEVASHIITSSRQQTVQGLRDLQPILAHLAAAESNLPRALELFPTYPFPRAIGKAVPGDYNGLQLTFNPDPLTCLLTPNPFPSACAAYQFSLPSASAGKTPKTAPTTPSVPVPLPSLPVHLPALPTPSPSSSDLLGGLFGGYGGSR